MGRNLKDKKKQSQQTSDMPDIYPSKLPPNV